MSGPAEMGLDDLDEQVQRLKRSHPAPHFPESPHPTTPEVDAYGHYVIATRALRDAELALKAAQENYRRALEALNKAIAPLPGKP